MSAWADTLESLLRERGPALFGYAYVLTGSSDAAEDLLQDALVRAFRSGRGSRDVNTAHAYVKRAITSAFIDSGRRSAARPRTVTQAGLERATTPDHAPASAAATDLRAALLTLPPRERACVVLRYLEDLPVASVAAELGLAVGTVKRYLADGVSRLRAMELDVDLSEAETIPVTEGRVR
jgi:RNA polymerase sigma factor (sigma-70 family)